MNEKKAKAPSLSQTQIFSYFQGKHLSSASHSPSFALFIDLLILGIVLGKCYAEPITELIHTAGILYPREGWD